MGPEATWYFCREVTRLTAARCDQEHLEMIVYSLPQTPDRTAAIFQQGPSPLEWLRHGVERLAEWGAGFIALPCNTAHYWYEALAGASRVPVLHLIEATVQELARQAGDARAVGLLATAGTLRTQLYSQALGQAGIVSLEPDEAGQRQVSAVIAALKAGGDPAAAGWALGRLAEELTSRGAEAVILGCTDLSPAGRMMNLTLPVVDSTAALAAKAVRVAVGEEEIAGPAGRSGRGR